MILSNYSAKTSLKGKFLPSYGLVEFLHLSIKFCSNEFEGNLSYLSHSFQEPFRTVLRMFLARALGPVTRSGQARWVRPLTWPAHEDMGACVRPPRALDRILSCHTQALSTGGGVCS